MAVSAGMEQRKEAGSLVAGEEVPKKSILIYSPDLNFCFSLSMLFQDRFNVSTTTNLSMLETFVANYSADLVMIDAVPSARIIERLAGLREAGHQIPVIMLTGSNQDCDKKKAMSLGADLYCLKPKDAKEWDTLTDSIGQFWIRRTMNRENAVNNNKPAGEPI